MLQRGFGEPNSNHFGEYGQEEGRGYPAPAPSRLQVTLPSVHTGKEAADPTSGLTKRFARAKAFYAGPGQPFGQRVRMLLQRSSPICEHTCWQTRTELSPCWSSTHLLRTMSWPH